MRLPIFRRCFIFILLVPLSGIASPQADPPETGNFAVSFSQEPGPLIAFGQNIVARHQAQIALFGDDYVVVQRHEMDFIPGFLYGISDDLSIYFRLPFTPSYRTGSAASAGLEDATLQMEYAYYTRETHQFADQATLVGSVNLPTGSSTKNPPTGYGSSSFFIGGTFSRLYTTWYFFTSEGATLTTPHGQTRFGDQFLYQGGVGRNMFDIDSRWIFAWILEADGQYTQKNKISGTIDPNSGGNVVYLTPSLLASSRRLTAQAGIGAPVTQHLFGNQTSNKYVVAFNLSWTL
jgi:hypothetical protein